MQANQHLRFSILTPALPERMDQVKRLFDEVKRQVGALPVEHLGLLNNRKSTVGQVRDTLLRAARGDYVAFVDDDDWVEPDYVSSILAAIESQPDVVTFRQLAIVNGVSGEIEFHLGSINEQFRPREKARRNAWHICAWKRSVAILSHFPNANYAEDLAFVTALWKLPGLREVHVPRILHQYRFDSKTTTCPPDAPYIEVDAGGSEQGPGEALTAANG